MSKLSCGIVGLPNVGKSTLFNALVKKKLSSASNYPFCTIDPSVGVVELPDERLKVLSAISKSKQIVPATLSFVDIAGLVKGASQGEGLGNRFLSSIRETDVIIHVVRCFDDDEIIHISGEVDPISDIEVINLELILADLQMAENSLKKLEKQLKGDKSLAPSIDLLRKISAHLNENQPVRSLDLNQEERAHLKLYPFITLKKVIYAANVVEQSLSSLSDNGYVKKVRAFADKEKSDLVVICARLEEELAQLGESDMREYLDSLEIKEIGLDQLIRISFETLGLITFLTTGEKETRAWTVKKDTPADQAAGTIHSDIQKSFIKAQVIKFEDMVACQGEAEAKALGKAKLEGRDYPVQDGDVILFFHGS